MAVAPLITMTQRRKGAEVFLKTVSASLRLCVAVTFGASPLMACTSPCGLKLQEHVFLSASQQRDAAIPCCGGSAYRDVDLSTVDDIEVDLSNLMPADSHVDGFLTTAGCDKLFDSYSGSASGALCTIHIGPVTPRAVGSRKKIAPGRYRLFAQSWATNQSSASGSLDMGIWSTACKWNPISP